MKVLMLAFLVALAPAISFAQRGGGGHGGGGGGFHGGGGGGGFRGGAVGGGGFRGGTVGGFSGANRGFVGGNRSGYGSYGGYGYGRGYGGYGYGRGFGLGFGFGFGWPYYGYGWPYYGYGYGAYACDPYVFDCYGGGYYGDGGYYGGNYGSTGYYPDSSGYAYGGGYAQAPVVVNQQYGNPPAPSASQYYRTPDYYLIAFSDHTIQAALSYHVEGDTLHYTTMQHEEKTAPLSSVDRRFSEQLNRDRRVNFQLP
jgi:hypothetical protein